MKNPIEVLRAKEQEITRIKKEIEALRIAAQLLGDENQPLTGQSVEARSAMDVH